MLVLAKLTNETVFKDTNAIKSILIAINSRLKILYFPSFYFIFHRQYIYCVSQWVDLKSSFVSVSPLAYFVHNILVGYGFVYGRCCYCVSISQLWPVYADKRWDIRHYKSTLNSNFGRYFGHFIFFKSMYNVYIVRSLQIKSSVNTCSNSIIYYNNCVL